MGNVMVTMTMEDLESMLWQQKNATADYITRNLSTFKWFNDNTATIDCTSAKEEIVREVNKSPFAKDFQVLQKYHK